MALASCARVGGASRCTVMTRPELELEFELELVLQVSVPFPTFLILSISIYQWPVDMHQIQCDACRTRSLIFSYDFSSLLPFCYNVCGSPQYLKETYCS